MTTRVYFLITANSGMMRIPFLIGSASADSG